MKLTDILLNYQSKKLSLSIRVLFLLLFMRHLSDYIHQNDINLKADSVSVRVLMLD